MYFKVVNGILMHLKCIINKLESTVIYHAAFKLKSIHKPLLVNCRPKQSALYLTGVAGVAIRTLTPVTAAVIMDHTRGTV